MLLAVDIGNTYIKLGVFDGDKLLGPWRVGTDPSKLADEYAVLITNLLALEGILQELGQELVEHVGQRLKPIRAVAEAGQREAS